jgi:hypothetical protein
MNLDNLVLRMVDQIISYPIAHVPLYLGTKGALYFFRLVIIFAVGFNVLYKFVQFVHVLSLFIAKMDVVQIITYQFIQKCSP